MNRKLKEIKQIIIIIQKGSPLQKPARPVLILHAKPITNIEKRNTPKIIVNFSLFHINI